MLEGFGGKGSGEMIGINLIARFQATLYFIINDITYFHHASNLAKKNKGIWMTLLVKVNWKVLSSSKSVNH